MNSKKSKNLLAEAFKSLNALTNLSESQANTLPIESSNINDNDENFDFLINDDFENDKEFDDICNSITSIHEPSTDVQDIIRSDIPFFSTNVPGTSNYQNLPSSYNKFSNKFNDKRPNNVSLLSYALSQSSEIVNISTKVESPKGSAYYAIKAERDKLKEEIFCIKGELILSQENQTRILNNRELKIKSLQEELDKVKNEDKRLIEKLRTQLQFKEANIMTANQKAELLENCRMSADEEYTPTKSKRQKLHMIQPSVKRSNFFTDNSFTSDSSHTKVQHSTDLPGDNRDIVRREFEDERWDMVTSVDESSSFIDHKEIPEVTVADRTNNAITATEDATMEEQYSVPIKYNCVLSSNVKDETSDLLLIVAKQNMPMKCCNSTYPDNMGNHLLFATNKLIQLLYEAEVTEPDVTDTRSQKVLLDLDELKRFVVPMINKLSVSITKRSGSLIDTEIKRLISYQVFKKKKLFVNSTYCCCYRYIFPLWETLKKLVVMGSTCPFLISELFVDYVVPNMLSTVNSFQTVFCCQPLSDSLHPDCACFTTNLETEFTRFTLESFISVLSHSNESQTKIIYQHLFKSFTNLMPLFGSRIDLKVITMKLFNRMSSYNLTVRCSSIIDEHKPVNCLLVIIVDLLRCSCLEFDTEGRTCVLLDQVTEFVVSMCENNFNWKHDCGCIGKIISIMTFFGRIVVRDILHNRCSSATLVSLKGLLTALVQLSNTLGKDTFNVLTNNEEYQSWLVTAYVVSREHIHLLIPRTSCDYLIINLYCATLANRETD